MTENLNKENFWNKIEQEYPDALAHFNQWFKQYQAEINWNNLFRTYRDPRILGIQFHDLPFEMQNGILARYELEMYNEPGGKEKYPEIAKTYHGQVHKIFYDLQRRITQRRKNAN